MDDSVVIVSHLCGRCGQQMDVSSDCSRCDYVEEMSCGGRPSDQLVRQSPQAVDNSAQDVANESIAICCICLDALTSGAADHHVLQCCHRFHKKCITEWFSKSTSCPMCRQTVPSEARRRRPHLSLRPIHRLRLHSAPNSVVITSRPMPLVRSTAPVVHESPVYVSIGEIAINEPRVGRQSAIRSYRAL